MIDGLKPYGEYRESGVTWLGKMPSHWSILPNRAIFEEIKDRNCPDEQMLSVTITRGVIQQRALLSNSSKKDSSRKDKSSYKLVCPDDIAYNKMRAWQGSIGVSDFRGIISPAYVVVRLRKENNARYYHHLFRTPAFAKEAERWSYGITSDMWSLRPEHFKLIRSPIPPPDEQAAIERFLDHANQRIDRFIRTKKKVIALLNEQKQAIIHRAVTRGIDPDVKMKDSGIPWLGEIPEDWQVRRLGTLISLITGFPFSSSGFLQNDNQVRLLRGINVTPTGVRWESVVRWKRSEDDGLSEYELQPGDIVLGMDRPIISTGVRAAVIEEKDTPSLLLQRVARLRPNDLLDAGFLMLLLKGKMFIQYMAPIFTGISVPHLSPEQIRSFKVVLPKIPEQKMIVREIDASTNTINETIRRTEREIDLIREYRTRLIADVVTGKVDVREAARTLPTSSEEIPLEPDSEDLDDESELEPTEAAA